MSTPAESTEPVITTHPVESSLIASIGYDSASETLQVTFKRGGTYRYANFPAQEWEQFKGAESIGRHFLRTIKDRFVHRKLD